MRLLAAMLCLAISGAGARADEEAAAKLFKNHCAACHTIEAGTAPRQGPNLHGIVGRKAGSLEGFKYSEGLKAANWEWTPEQLDNWLTNPREMIPDTLMSVYKQKDPEKRKLIIDYLVTNSSK